jgi:hypothetical protein
MMEIVQRGGMRAPGFGMEPVRRGGTTIGVGQSDCDESVWRPWKTYPTEAQLAAADQEMTTLIEALDTSIAQCDRMPDIERQLWKSTTYAKYKIAHAAVADYLSGKTKLMTFPVPTGTANDILRGNLMCTLNSLRSEYESVRARVLAYCGAGTVKIPPNAPALPGSEPGPDQKKDDVLSTVKTVAIAAVLVTGVIYLVPVIGRMLPEPERDRRRRD